jgi:hypothetical protein
MRMSFEDICFLLQGLIIVSIVRKLVVCETCQDSYPIYTIVLMNPDTRVTTIAKATGSCTSELYTYTVE